MPNAAVVAAALTDGSAHTLGLYIAGLDVSGVPGSGGPGVSRESIDLEEQGPDGVSSLHFVIDDPNGVVALTEGNDVRMHDLIADLPLFLGFVQSWAVMPWGIGRQIDVQCIGIEAVLDWSIVPSFSYGLATYQFFLDGLRAATRFAGPQLRIVQDTSVNNNSTFAAPVEFVSNFQMVMSVTGQSFREALRAGYAGVDSAAVPFMRYVTVDFWGNLRVWINNGTLPLPPSDYATLTVTDTYASTRNAANLQHESDATGAIHSVYIKGANANGTGLVTDGTNIQNSQIAYLEDSTIDTAAKLNSAGVAYLSNHQGLIRGTLTVEDWVPTTNIRAGSLLALTDTQTGATATYEIKSIRKTFSGSRQTWVVNYGGFPARGSTLLRRLTRTIRS